MATSALGQTERYWPAFHLLLSHKYSEEEIADINSRRRAYARELKLQILGLKGPWRSWRPDISMKGITNLQQALARGRGVVLWVTECAFSTLIVKIALYDAGYRVCQLSRPGHGFSSTAFGIRHLNPLWTEVEDRFIGERILIKEATAADALAILRARLVENKIVIITVAWEAHKFVDVPFLGDHLKLPTGPIRLTRTTGASLLPVFTVADETGGFEVSVEEPLYPTNGAACDEGIAATYAKRLESFVLKHPDQWKGWRYLLQQNAVALALQNRAF